MHTTKRHFTIGPSASNRFGWLNAKHGIHVSLTILFVLLCGWMPAVRAQVTEDQAALIRQLMQRIDQLERKVASLESRETPSTTAAASTQSPAEIKPAEPVAVAPATAPKPAPAHSVASLDERGFFFRSADSNFVFRFRGYVQADARFYPDDNPQGVANDTFVIRRARPIFEGTVYRDYDFRLMLDFGTGPFGTSVNGSSIQDAFLNARFMPELQLQIGKFKVPGSLEWQRAADNLLFVEYGYPKQLTPNRDVGAQLQGSFLGNRLEYAVGVFNGALDNSNSDIESADDDKSAAARIFANPFGSQAPKGLRGFGFGLAGTYGNQEGVPRPLLSPGLQRSFNYRVGVPENAPNVIADGAHWRAVPQAYYYLGPFGIYGEYAMSDMNIRQAGAGLGAGTELGALNRAWQISGSWFLTGEANSFKAVTPKHNFLGGSHGWGAWELAARVGGLDVDNRAFPVFADPTKSTSGSFSVGVGLNWHLNRNVLFNVDYEQTDFHGGSTPLFEHGEKVIMTRAQVSF